MPERNEQEQQLRVEAEKKLRQLLEQNPQKTEELDTAIARLNIDEGKISVQGTPQEGRESGLAVNEIAQSTGLSQILPAEKLQRAIKTIEFYNSVREAMRTETADSGFFDVIEVGDELTAEVPRAREPVWYEEIIDDLRQATSRNASNDERHQAVERLRASGVNMPDVAKDPDNTPGPLESNEDRNRIKVGSAVDFLEGRRNNRWSSKEAALKYLNDELGVDVEHGIQPVRPVTVADSNEGEPTIPPTPEPAPIPPTPRPPEEEERGETMTEKFLNKMDLALMDNRAAEERGLSGERRQAIKDMSEVVDFDFIFGDDLDEDDREGRKARKSDVRRAVKAMRTGEVTEEQRDLLQDAGINIATYGVTVKPREVEVAEAGIGVEEARFFMEYGCTKDEYDRVLRACFDQIFVRGARDGNQVLNSLTEGAGEWVTIKGRRMPLPPQLREKLLSMELDAWIGVSRVMGEWAEIKNVDEITPATLKQGLFISRYAETSFGAMQRKLFPKMTGDVTTSYTETEVVGDIGVEVSKSMKTLLDYFGRPDPSKPHRLLNDYWPFISSEPSVRAGLYESLGINRYYGEAAFAFLLSNFMLAQKGVGLDPFSTLVKPPEKRLANYEVSEERDPLVRMVVQQIKKNGGSYDRQRVLRELKTLVPARLIPTGLDGGGETALTSEEGWISWRNRTFISGAERKGRVINNERVDVPASDVDSKLTILRSAIDVHNAQKAVFAPDAGIDKLATMKTKLFIHLLGNLDPLGYSVRTVDFAEGRESSSNVAWISRSMSGTAKGYLFCHSIADTENRNGKPWKMVDFVQRAGELFQYQSQSGKLKFVGFGEDLNIDHMKSLAKYTISLYEDCERIINPFRGMGIVSSMAMRNAGVPKWYGRAEDVHPAFRSFLNQQQGYRGLWEKLETKLKRI